MRVLIFGASGFIGGHLVLYMEKVGWDVLALSRRPEIPGYSGCHQIWSLGESLPDNIYRGFDFAVHLAHDFDGEPGAKRTIDGISQCVQQLRLCGVKRQVIFSSYSAGAHAKSIYGVTKYFLEERFINSPDIEIARPGLVIGDGGLYARIRKWAVRLPVVPLPDGGRGKVPVIAINRLCSEIVYNLESECFAPESNIFEPQLVSLRDIVLNAAGDVGRRPVIVNIPSRVLLWVLKLAARLRVPIPVNSDNLDGFIANQSAMHSSTLQG